MYLYNDRSHIQIIEQLQHKTEKNEYVLDTTKNNNNKMKTRKTKTKWETVRPLPNWARLWNSFFITRLTYNKPNAWHIFCCDTDTRVSTYIWRSSKKKAFKKRVHTATATAPHDSLRHFAHAHTSKFFFSSSTSSVSW